MSDTSIRVHRDIAADFAESARSRGGMLVLVTGLPGMGKTHLLHAVGEQSVGGQAAHYIAADEFEQDIPYAFVERILSGGLSENPTVDANSTPLEVSRRLIHALVDGPRRRLRTVLLDDTQWIDEASARTLRFVTPRVAQRGVLLGVAARSPLADDSMISHLREYADASPSHVHHRVEPLSTEEIRSLAVERFGTGITVQAAETLRDLTGGTFLGVESLFQGITNSEICELHLTWNLPVRRAALPESPFLSGFARLSPRGRAAVELVSVAAREISRRDVERAATASDVESDVDEAVRAGVLVESGFGATVETAHALVASAVRDSLSDERSATMHRALSEVSDGYASVLHALRGAQSWDQTVAGQVDRFVEDAVARGRFNVACRILRASLDVAEGAARQRLLTDLALLHLRTKTGYEVLDLYDDIEALPPGPIRDCVLVVMHVHRFDQDAAQTMLWQLLRREADDPETLTIQSFLVFMGGVLVMRSPQPQLSEELFSLGRQLWRRAPDDPETVDDPRLRWMVGPHAYEAIVDGFGIVAWHLDYRTDDVLAVLPGLVDRALALPDDVLKIDALVPLAGAAVAVGDVALGHSLARTGVRILDTASTPPWAAGSIRAIHAHTLALMGRLRESEDLIEQSRELSYDVLDVETRFTFAAMHSWVRTMAGSPDASGPLQEAQRLEELPWEAYATDILVMAECERARVADDPHAVLAATETDRIEKFRSTQRGFLTHRAHALIDLGRHDDAAELIETLAAWRGTRWQEMWGTLAWLRARLADAAGAALDAERHYREAVERSETLSPMITGLTLADYGAFLLEQKREDDAEQALSQAVGQLEEAGARGYLPRVAARLSAITDRDRHARAGRVALLTDREHEVARLLVDGRSNPQIAEMLVVSPATARFHVSNVLRKLGVARRTEVAAIASDLLDHADR